MARNVINTPMRSRTEEMIIGKNKYILTTHYKENGRETAEQKFARLVSKRITEAAKTPTSSVE